MDYGGGDHKRQTRDAYGRSSQAKVCGRRRSSILLYCVFIVRVLMSLLNQINYDDDDD